MHKMNIFEIKKYTSDYNLRVAVLLYNKKTIW